MRMGHLAQHAEAFCTQFVGQRELLELIGERYEFTQAEAPVDSTALRYSVGESGAFGIIANESVPFCRRSEEHTSELQSLMRISYAVFCLKTKTRNKKRINYSK